MNNLLLKQICQHFCIGESLNFKKIISGRVNNVWLITTAKGKYALKKFDNQNLKELAHTILFPQDAHEVAMWMSAHGVPAVLALEKQSQIIFEHEKQKYIVSPWIDSLQNNIDEKQCTIIGGLLAQIHSANFQPAEFRMPNWHERSKRNWSNTVKFLQEHHPQFALKILDEVEHLTRWSSHQIGLTENLVFSHRDLDPSNVIWENKTSPKIIDWEYAGYINTSLDVFITALNWSNVTSGNINFAKFEKIVEGYQSKQHPFEINFSQQILFAYSAYCLDWINFNLTKVLAHRVTARYELEIVSSIRALHAVEQNYIKLKG